MKKTILLMLFFALSKNVLSQRNVVLLIADDLSTYYCGFYENHLDTAKLPNIRKLLSKGVRFTNAMSNPVCSPTRAGILTGRYSFRTGVGNFIGKTNNETPLDTSEIAITKLLKIYKPTTLNTACIGKWHLQQPAPIGNLMFPNLMGFNWYQGCFGGSVKNYFNWTKYTNGVETTVTNYATTETVNDAVQWIKTQNSNPFFLWLAFNAPHIPYHVPPANLHSYQGLTGTKEDIANNRQLYFLASVEAMDTEIGRLFDSLQVINKLDSTDFIFLGDNGDEVTVSQNAVGAKGTLYQEGIAIPLLISGPSVVNPGRVSSALVNTQDLFATILELLGDSNWQSHIPLNRPVDSKSILPIIKNQTDSIRPWAFTELFKVTHDSLEGKTIRNKEYKLIRFDNGIEEFYNLLTDSYELNNLLAGSMTATQTTNYLYLCQQMSTLLGQCGSLCNGPLTIAKSNMPVYCFGQSTGAIQLTVSGGTPPYNYQWSNGATTKNLSNISAGNYSVVVTDFCNNSVIEHETIIQVSKINIIKTIQSTTCGQPNGSISIDIANGISPYQVLWSTGATNQSINNAISGIYMVTVTDAFGCSVTASQFIASSTSLITELSFQNTSCGKNTGSIDVVIHLGTPPYNYIWNNGSSTAALQKIGSETYTVTVTDAAGCSKIDSAFVYCIPRKPTVIYGPQTICSNQQSVNYSTDLVPGATSYVWSKPGKATIISGQGTPAIVVSFGNQGGNVQVKAGNDFGYSSNLSQLITMLTSCKEGNDFATQDFTLSPNPFQQQLKLEFNDLIGSCNFHIYDIIGQLVFSEALDVPNEFNTLELNLSDLSKGVFFLKAEINEKVIVKKIVKE